MLLHTEQIEYAHALTRGVTDPAECEKLRKHNVGLVGVFFDRVAQREVVVATTHLLFNPKRGIVKLKQHPAAAGYAVSVPGGGAEKYVHGAPESPPKAAGVAASELAGGGAAAADVDEKHALAGELLSAYGHGRGEPEATSFHKRFLGTVDYVWYTSQHLVVKTVLPTPSRAELLACRSLPDWHTPSDHVPIACDLEWVARGPPRNPASPRNGSKRAERWGQSAAADGEKDVLSEPLL